MNSISGTDALENKQPPLHLVSHPHRPKTRVPRFGFVSAGEHKSMGAGYYLMLLRELHGRQGRAGRQALPRAGRFQR